MAGSGGAGRCAFRGSGPRWARLQGGEPRKGFSIVSREWSPASRVRSPDAYVCCSEFCLDLTREMFLPGSRRNRCSTDEVLDLYLRRPLPGLPEVVLLLQVEPQLRRRVKCL